ncbi:MAG TPA: helix-turn-helix transcriptional regulator [Clostridia bacterium]|nr:helix-turn-helix transcriptional regulator [Clostridia bacterium]HPJ75842.1 helix-turn-helix transcriptional regulator [Clostridia bacterium]HXK71785.1 helix-turn-helix transcriptional regulator [Clostridia bacterium]
MINFSYIGQRIRTKRKELKMTQQELSEMASISPAYISRIEGGQQNITLDTIEKIAKSIDEDPIYLISGVKDDDVNYVKKLFNRAPAQFLYLFELALVELEEKGILNIKP